MSVKLEEYIRHVQECKQRHHGWAPNIRHLANTFGLSLKEVGDLNMKCAEAGYPGLLTPLAPVYEGNEGVDVINAPMNNLDEGSAEPEFYFVRRKGTVGLTYELGRTNFSYGDAAPLYLFEDLLSAVEQLHFFGLDPDQWDYATSSEFGGIASLVKRASNLPTPTPTSVNILGHMTFAPFGGATIEHAIETFESSSWTEQWKSGRPKTPYWVLTDSAYQNLNVLTHVFAISIHGVKAVCLFKTERDAEVFRHSGWVSANEWKSDGPVGSERGVRYLKEFPHYERSSHAVINPPPGSPGSIGSLRVTPIEVIIDDVEEKGHILDLD